MTKLMTIMRRINEIDHKMMIGLDGVPWREQQYEIDANPELTRLYEKRNTLQRWIDEQDRLYRENAKKETAKFDE